MIASEKLTKQFIKGLEKYNLSFDDIEKNNWHYCGGNSNSHLKYYKLSYPNRDIPADVTICICSHPIVENCYITDGTDMLILGKCCIKKFIPKSSRSCEKCGLAHKNRKNNRCNECRIGICDNCGISCDVKHKKCHTCTYPNSGICNTCETPCDYKQCYSCTYPNSGICESCDKKCDVKYKKCFKCNKKY